MPVLDSLDLSQNKLDKFYLNEQFANLEFVNVSWNKISNFNIQRVTNATWKNFYLDLTHNYMPYLNASVAADIANGLVFKIKGTKIISNFSIRS